MKTISIIGTAGRGEDYDKMSYGLYVSMVRDAQNRLTEFCTTLECAIDDICLVSGGAAFSDHISVSLYLMGFVKSLHLYLPAQLIASTGRFEQGNGSKDPGRVSNYHHDRFSAKMPGGRNTRLGILEAVSRGATIDVIPGFFQRNIPVSGSDAVIAYTWGDGAVPKDGGTKHTWDLAQTSHKTHIPLSSLTVS